MVLVEDNLHKNGEKQSRKNVRLRLILALLQALTLRVAADARQMRPITIGPSQLRSRHIVEKLFIPITIRILLVVHGRAAGPGKIGVASALFARRTTKNGVGKKLEKKTYFSKVLSTRHMGEKRFPRMLSTRHM